MMYHITLLSMIVIAHIQQNTKIDNNTNTALNNYYLYFINWILKILWGNHRSMEVIPFKTHEEDHSSV